MPNDPFTPAVLNTFTEQLTNALAQSTASFNWLFEPDEIGAVIDSGPSEIPVRYMSRRIRLSQPVSKAKRCTYLDWKPTPSGGT